MRSVIGILVLLGTYLFACPMWATNQCSSWSTIKGGDYRPWPWGSEIELPWSSMDGTWVGSVGSCKSYFVFKMVTVRSGNAKRLWIGQIDPKTCKVVAEGYGSEKKNVVTGKIVDAQKNQFTVTVRSFDSDTLSSVGMGDFARAIKQKVFVVTVQPTSNKPGFFSFEIKKVSSKLNSFSCKSLNRP